MNTLEEINIAAENPAEFIKNSTERYKAEIAAAARVAADNDDIKIIAIAGPSCSGKTTTAKLLLRELEKRGEKTAVVSLDDFYNERDKVPVLPDGSPDYETVDALNKELIGKCLNEIIKDGKTYLPKYDFETKKRTDSAELLDIGEKGIVIVEGLHALNPEITDRVLRKNIYKIYISVNSSVEDSNGVSLLSSRQIRLVRRTLRDERFRGYGIKETLKAWDKVVSGETKYLYPYRKTADTELATFHGFELCVYKDRFCRMRPLVDKSSPWYEYFIKTVNALELFTALKEDIVPDDSLIREFIG